MLILFKILLCAYTIRISTPLSYDFPKSLLPPQQTSTLLQKVMSPLLHSYLLYS